MKHLAAGVIGHVNHGKTQLVKALSGIDTDRLPEEKRRGMSIVLGFAHLRLDEGLLDLVDVPGHEQFVRTMVAGATGIHASVLVVDAREGIKPQTVEHVAIADLLGLRCGVVVLTKCDLADEGQREAVRQQLQSLLRGTHLAQAPRISTSALSGEGLPALRQALGRLLASAEAPAGAGSQAHLPIDRVFSLPGHGTVVTGTLRGGPLRVGDTVALLPRGSTTTVRQLQVHKQGVGQAFAGQRVGVNLRQLAAADVQRGDVLAPPGRLAPGVLLDVALRGCEAAGETRLDGARVRLLFGTTDVAAVLRLLGPAEGGGWFAQLRTARPVVAMAGEPFILRRESPAATLGGGRILDASPRRHRRGDVEALAGLRVLAGGSALERLRERLRAAGLAGLGLRELAEEWRLPDTELARTAGAFARVHQGRLWHAPLIESLQQQVLAALRRFHREQPLRPGAPAALCRSALPREAGEPLLRLLLESMAAQGQLVRRAGQVALAGHDPLQALDAASRSELLRLAAAFREGGMNPPDPPAPGAEPRRRALLDLLVAQGELLLLPGQPPSQRIAFHRDAVRGARERLAQAYPPPAAFTVSQARELLGSTRKFTVPLLEHLHATGQTRRRGDQHLFVPARTPGGE